MKKEQMQEKLNNILLDLREEEKEANTIEKYKHNILHFLEWLPDDKEIAKEDILQYKRYIIDELQFKTTTINNYIVSVNMFLRRCGLGDLTVKKLKKQSKASLNEMLTISDYKRLLRFAKRQDQSDTYLIMKILAQTGIRIDELKYFTVENVKSNYIYVRNKGKERVIILRQDLAREIRKYCRDRKIKAGYIFIGAKNGKMICKSTIWRRMKKIAGAARVKKEKVHAHSFRHLFAKQFLEEYNGNITELADILGHSNIETTRIYARTSDEEKRRKLENMSFK
jgi:integrase